MEWPVKKGYQGRARRGYYAKANNPTPGGNPTGSAN